MLLFSKMSLTKIELEFNEINLSFHRILVLRSQILPSKHNFISI